MSEPPLPLISLIVPTRGRIKKLQQFLDSVVATTARLDRVEVILVADSDDAQTLAFRYPSMPFRMVTVPPGQTMGVLNRAGYAACCGEFIMLTNDDVIVRTRDWDEKVLEVFRTYADGIVLVHVNDLIFQEKLCTFPFLTRRYCEMAGGICPEDYARYRIDDHIYNVFNLLAVLARKRIVYLPQIVFEHTNTGTGTGTDRYVPIPEIHAADTRHFDRLLPDRKALAIELAETIDRHLAAELVDTRRKLLAPIEDSVALRKPEFVTVRNATIPRSSTNTRVTIGVVSADIRNPHAKTCLDAIKQHTTNYDLIILDNNSGPGFNHSREMNRIRAICRTEFLVLMDDDVFVEPGWLDGLLRCVTPQTGVVTPMHMDSNRELSYAGVVMSPDHSGHHTHSYRVPDKPEPVQTLCSAVMLIDMTKCGHIAIDESYSKYFLDIDYGLRVWESGHQVMLAPDTILTHVGGATLQQGSQASNELFEIQRAHFVREWITNGRYPKLEAGVWANVPEIAKLVALPDDLERALHTCFVELNTTKFRKTLQRILDGIEPIPVLRQWVNNHLANFIERRHTAIDPLVRGEFDWLRHSHLDTIVKVGTGHSFHSPALLETCGKYNLVRYQRKFWAIPLALGHFDIKEKASQKHPEVLSSNSLGTVRELALGLAIQETSAPRSASAPTPGRFAELRKERELLGGWWPAGKIVTKRMLRQAIISAFGYEIFHSLKTRWRREGHNAHNIVPYLGRFWGLPHALGHVNLALPADRERPGVIVADTLRGSLAAIDWEPHNFAETGHADSMRWIETSPQTELKKSYRGYKIYRYEFKFFGVPETNCDFNYDDFLTGKYGECVFIAHSLAELKASIDRRLQSGEGRSVLLAPFSIPIRDPAKGHAIALTTSDFTDETCAARVIRVNASDLFGWAREMSEKEIAKLKESLREQNISRAVIPWRHPDSWHDNSLEVIASKLVDVVDIVQPGGSVRTYEGENLHRLIYNKAYLCSMFSVVPQPAGKTVLEVGCSDGLVCDIFLRLGAVHVTGIDVMRTVGCGFRNPQIAYRTMDAAHMDFPDQTFDISYSIATFEHLPDPCKVLSEMLRVTKVGGYCYVQAAPLYHTPFGHHMFAYFQDYPWIHLRKTPAEILRYMLQRGIDRRIEEDHAIQCEEYLAEMLTRDHVNGLFLQNFRLDEFAARADVEVSMRHTSFEGRELLTSEIISEIPGIHPDRLVEHGFEIAFRRLS